MSGLSRATNGLNSDWLQNRVGERVTQLPDDCVEYAIHMNEPLLADSENRETLRDVLRAVGQLNRQHLNEHIWQRESFSLQLARQDGKPWLDLLRSFANVSSRDIFPVWKNQLWRFH